jgi:hypothetical protein
MHHKRKRPKSTRSGCLMCKPWKRQGSCVQHRAKISDVRRMEQFKCEGVR